MPITPEQIASLPQDIEERIARLTPLRQLIVWLILAGHSFAEVARLRGCRLQAVREHWCWAQNVTGPLPYTWARARGPMPDEIVRRMSRGQRRRRERELDQRMDEHAARTMQPYGRIDTAELALARRDA
jgi:hypothetical protein